ncbi:MAG TPA: hypothetical protein VNS46_21660 [Nocardioides sp.]|nr:hypothetical protein [Nocardioides sp.]
MAKMSIWEDIAPLAREIAERRGSTHLLHPEDRNRDTSIELIDVLYEALDNNDLTDAEAERALVLAEAGRLLKSSNHLAEELRAHLGRE